MLKLKRLSTLLLAGVLFFVLAAAGCGKKSDSSNTDGSSQNSNEPPAKLTMFFSSSGVVIPEDLDPNTEPFLKEFDKLANVDLEIIRPAYQDYVTKVNLAIASGDIPDIIHCYGTIVDEVRKAGADGAFVDLEPYITKSASLSKLYPSDVLNLMRYAAGDKKIYTLMGQDAKNSSTVIGRVDLINELNGGKMLATPDDWYQLAKKEKEKYPDSVPFSGYSGIMYLNTFFRAFGAEVNGNGVGWQLTHDKYISAFEALKMKDAVEFYKKLYNEKLLDPVFLTNNTSDYENRLFEKKSLIGINNSAQIIAKFMQTSLSKGDNKAIWAFVSHPMEPGADPENVYYKPAAIGSHGLAISSKCENVNAAMRVLETFLSDDVKTLSAWGREGIEYNVQNGKKVLNVEESAKTSWRSIYGFMQTFWFPEAVQVKAEELRPKLGSNADAFFNAYNSGLQIRDKEIYSQKPSTMVLSLSPDVLSLQNEALAASISIVVKAIVGEISMDEYDKQVSAYLKKYSSITDAYNKAYNAYKAKKG